MKDHDVETRGQKISLNVLVPVFILMPFFVKIKILYLTLKSGVIAHNMSLPAGDDGGFDDDADVAGAEVDDDGYFGGVGA